MAGKRQSKRNTDPLTRYLLMSLVFVLVGVLLFLGRVAERDFGRRDDPASTPVEDPVVKPQPESPLTKPHEMAYTIAMDGGEGFVLTPGQKEVIGDFMTMWYSDLGMYNDSPDYTALFEQDEDDDAQRHAAAIRTLVAIRSRGLIDLRLDRCDTTLTITDMEETDGKIRIELLEDSVMRFTGLTVDSYLYEMPHLFYLKETGEDAWILTYHEADDNPFFTFTYEAGNDYDKNLPQLLRAIERRHLLRGETVEVKLQADHPYDRAAAEEYMRAYCNERNEAWHAYDDVGGNCMNFGSQVLLAGTIPMDKAGDEQWYWTDKNRLSTSFINVGRFYDYARDNTGYGLVADVAAGYYTGEVGDILIFGIDDLSHTTVISGVVRDDAGQTVDYLLCSNTTNYRDFPAGAYYYTGHTLVKIFGWND